MWPFIALYGLYLILIDRRVKTVVLVLGSGLALVILWFVPEYLGSGDFLRAANRARQPNPDSAAFAAFPFLEVFNRSASVLTDPGLRRRRDRRDLRLARSQQEHRAGDGRGLHGADDLGRA